MKWWYENEEEEMKLYKNEDLCIECKNEFFSKPYDHRDPTPGQLGYCIKCDNCLIKEKKMEFLRERVFTSLNADELRAGDKVIVARSLSLLKTAIENTEKHIKTLEKINNEEFAFRFVVNNTTFPLAYLVERAENCTNCEGCGEGVDPRDERTKIMVCSQYKPKAEINLCDTCKDNFCECPAIGDNIKFGNGKGNDNVIECKCYKPKTEKKAEPHYRPFKNTDELVKVWCDKGGKWQKRELTMPHIWVRRKEGNIKGQLITEFSNSLWVEMGKEGYNMTDLLVHFTFLDGSPCGVEE